MTVDLNTRTWTSANQLGEEAASRLRLSQADHWLRADHGVDALVTDMQCVDVAVVHGFRSAMLGAHVPSEHIAELIARHPNSMIGIAGIDPLAPGSQNEIHRIIEMGMSGITISPSMQGLHPTHSAAMRIYESCEERGLPVMVSRPEIPLASSVLEFDRPGNWDEVARSFPQLKIVIGGLGFPWIDETLALLQKHENLFADLSIVVARPWQVRTALLNAQSLGILDRLLFASGWPATTPAHAIETLYSLNTFSQGNAQPSVPRSEIRTIIERDSLAALGIDRAPGSTTSTETDPSKFKSIRTDEEEANQALHVD